MPSKTKNVKSVKPVEIDIVADLEGDAKTSMNKFSIFFTPEQEGEQVVMLSALAAGMKEFKNRGMCKTLVLQMVDENGNIKITELPTFLQTINKGENVVNDVLTIIRKHGIKIRGGYQTERPNLRTYVWTEFDPVPAKLAIGEFNGFLRVEAISEIAQKVDAVDAILEVA